MIAKRELVRIVRTPQGVVVDPTGKIAGRGTYVHNTRSCWEQALKGPISHALRVELTEEDRQRLFEYLKTLQTGTSNSSSNPKKGSSEENQMNS